MNTPLHEKRPTGAGWTRLRPVHPPLPGTLAESWWRSGTTLVLTSLSDADYPDGSGVGPQWHVSVSDGGTRPTRAALRRALNAFGMIGAEEDNHHPGIARHFWRPVDPAKRVACECKTSEVTVTEPDGYRWTNPRDSACRGCEYQRAVGVPLPVARRGCRGRCPVKTSFARDWLAGFLLLVEGIGHTVLRAAGDQMLRAGERTRRGASAWSQWLGVAAMRVSERTVRPSALAGDGVGPCPVAGMAVEASAAATPSPSIRPPQCAMAVELARGTVFVLIAHHPRTFGLLVFNGEREPWRPVAIGPAWCTAPFATRWGWA